MMRYLVEDTDSIFHNKPVSYVQFCATLLTLPLIFRVVLLSCHANFLFVKFSFWTPEKCKKKKDKEKKEKVLKKVNKNLDTNVQCHYLYFISLIGLNMCYFTWLRICLGNVISVLHILIKPVFREDPNIFKSGGFRLCPLLFFKEMKKKEKKWSK